MSPASYLTAPPRVAGGSLPPLVRGSLLRRADHLGAAFEDPARIGDLRQQPEELSPLRLVDAGEELLLHLRDRPLGGRDLRTAFLGELDDVAAPIRGVATADDQALGLEIVEQPDQLARIDNDRIDQPLLAARLRAHLEEHANVRGIELARL